MYENEKNKKIIFVNRKKSKILLKKSKYGKI